MSTPLNFVIVTLAFFFFVFCYIMTVLFSRCISILTCCMHSNSCQYSLVRCFRIRSFYTFTIPTFHIDCEKTSMHSRSSDIAQHHQTGKPSRREILLLLDGGPCCSMFAGNIFELKDIKTHLTALWYLLTNTDTLCYLI